MENWKWDAGNTYDAFVLECAKLVDFPSTDAVVKYP